MDHFKLQILQEALCILENRLSIGICTAIIEAMESIAEIEMYEIGIKEFFPGIYWKIEGSIRAQNRIMYIWPCTGRHKQKRIAYLQRLIEEETK